MAVLCGMWNCDDKNAYFMGDTVFLRVERHGALDLTGINYNICISTGCTDEVILLT